MSTVGHNAFRCMSNNGHNAFRRMPSVGHNTFSEGGEVLRTKFRKYKKPVSKLIVLDLSPILLRSVITCLYVFTARQRNVLKSGVMQIIYLASLLNVRNKNKTVVEQHDGFKGVKSDIKEWK